MSCDHEITNESASCWKNISSCMATRNITKPLNVRSLAKSLFSLKSRCFPPLCFGKYQDSRENKTNCFPWDLALSVYYLSISLAKNEVIFSPKYSWWQCVVFFKKQCETRAVVFLWLGKAGLLFHHLISIQASQGHPSRILFKTT